MATRTKKIAVTSLLAATLAGTVAPMATALTEADVANTKPAGEAGKQNVPVDHSVLNAAVKRAQDAGLDVTQQATKTTHNNDTAAALATIAADEKAQAAAIDKAVADYTAAKAAADAKNKAAVDAWEAEQSRLEAENKAARDAALKTNADRKAEYEAKLEEWKAANAENEKLRLAQETGDPYVAQTPDALFNEQPFDFNDNKNTVAKATSLSLVSPPSTTTTLGTSTTQRRCSATR